MKKELTEQLLKAGISEDKHKKITRDFEKLIKKAQNQAVVEALGLYVEIRDTISDELGRAVNPEELDLINKILINYYEKGDNNQNHQE